MRLRVQLIDGEAPAGDDGDLRADVVVLRHSGGLWTVWKDQAGKPLPKRVPFDELPLRIKDTLGKGLREGLS